MNTYSMLIFFEGTVLGVGMALLVWMIWYSLDEITVEQWTMPTLEDTMGDLRLNEKNNSVEMFDGTHWKPIELIGTGDFEFLIGVTHRDRGDITEPSN